MAHGGSGMFPSSMHSSGDLCGGELLSEFFLRSLFSVCLERDLGGNIILSTWLASIGWRKTLVLR